mmetsp:Transcript_5479/g.6677  ORF Transcript_5479/g.6677 Transcript_5479/m.6677 type:complete len:86 (-) Transcript_5479:157-414(-)
MADSGGFVVECVVRCGDEEACFNMGTAGTYDLAKAKAVEVTTEHQDGPLKGLLGQLETVQLQSNYYLTQKLNSLKPESGKNAADS